MQTKNTKILMELEENRYYEQQQANMKRIRMRREANNLSILRQSILTR